MKFIRWYKFETKAVWIIPGNRSRRKKTSINAKVNKYADERIRLKKIYLNEKKKEWENFFFPPYRNDLVQKTMAQRIFPQTPSTTNVAT